MHSHLVHFLVLLIGSFLIHFDSNINPSLGESDGPAALVVVHGRHAELGLVGHVLDVNHEHVLREVSLLF